MTFEVQVLWADGSVATVGDDASVPLLMPPQGGRVVFAGVRATNVDGCHLQLTGALRNPATRQVMVDSRTVNLTPTGDGWGASAAPMESISAAIASFSNIPACPNQWSDSDLYGQPYDLELTIVDQEKRQLARALRVVPQCGEPENLAQCLCICRAGYGPDQPCADGGTE